jgi:ribosome modulation factor
MKRMDRPSRTTAPPPSHAQNPYHPFDETDAYRAFQEGWMAQRTGAARSASPYPFSRTREALAWLDGWTQAQISEEASGPAGAPRTASASAAGRAAASGP